jgi:hypothetical protein
MQEPTPSSETFEPDTLQIPALEGSALKLTGRPELADAETAYAGAVDVNWID